METFFFEQLGIVVNGSNFKESFNSIPSSRVLEILNSKIKLKVDKKFCK